MLKLTLDSSVFSRLKEDLPIIAELVRLSDENKIELFVAPQTFMEISKMGKNLKLVLDLIERVECYEEIDESVISDDGIIHISSDEPFEREFIKVKRIHSQEDTRTLGTTEKSFMKFEKRCVDPEIFVYHFRNHGDYFITKDKAGFIKERRQEKLEKLYSTKIRILNKSLIKDLESLS